MRELSRGVIFPFLKREYSFLGEFGTNSVLRYFFCRYYSAILPGGLGLPGVERVQ